MYVYLPVETVTGAECKVGFFDPNGDFHIESFHCDAEGAAQRVSYLNGGGPPCRRRAWDSSDITCTESA